MDGGGQLVAGRWGWVDGGGQVMVGGWWWAGCGGQVVVGRWWWVDGGGQVVVGRWWWVDGGGQVVVGRWSCACSVCFQCMPAVCEVSVSVHTLLRWQPLVHCTMGRWFHLRT